GCPLELPLAASCQHLVVVIWYARAVRDLHSFPTRRSSDLDRGVVLARDLAGPAAVAVDGEVFDRRRRAAERALRVTAQLDLAKPDRKSTRLNSSHLGISYAVFCLKKKTVEDRFAAGVEDPA